MSSGSFSLQRLSFEQSFIGWNWPADLSNEINELNQLYEINVLAMFLVYGLSSLIIDVISMYQKAWYGWLLFKSSVWVQMIYASDDSELFTVWRWIQYGGSPTTRPPSTCPWTTQTPAKQGCPRSSGTRSTRAWPWCSATSTRLSTSNRPGDLPGLVRCPGGSRQRQKTLRPRANVSQRESGRSDDPMAPRRHSWRQKWGRGYGGNLPEIVAS